MASVKRVISTQTAPKCFVTDGNDAVNVPNTRCLSSSSVFHIHRDAENSSQTVAQTVASDEDDAVIVPNTRCPSSSSVSHILSDAENPSQTIPTTVASEEDDAVNVTNTRRTTSPSVIISKHHDSDKSDCETSYSDDSSDTSLSRHTLYSSAVKYAPFPTENRFKTLSKAVDGTQDFL
eukprot:GHVT01017817.1.p1 GENE.GHVT01017817.1~~GHVT01017817.1.p1  ORF type:complete len:201 (+),score=5.71 GHVT01017817.1:71-604(+)